MIRFRRDDKKNPEKMKMLPGRFGHAAGMPPERTEMPSWYRDFP